MNFLVTMSGGTTQVINATLAGCIDAIFEIYPQSKIYIPKPGIAGLFTDNLFQVKKDADTKKLALLPGSSITGTTRIKKLNKKEIDNLSTKLDNYKISTWINIGGNGTIKQSKQLSKHLHNINFIALPKTIDNDLGDAEFKKLLYTPGYLSTIKYIKSHVNSLIRENDGASHHDKVIISQVFGRETSHIAAIAGLVKNEKIIILFPESPVTYNTFLKTVKQKIKNVGGCIVIIPEGYQFLNQEINFDKSFDLSGQVMWGSSYDTISQQVNNLLNSDGIQTRICNTTIEQRQNPHTVDRNDIERSYKIGFDSIKHKKAGFSNFFNSIQLRKNIKNKKPYFKTVPIDLEQITDFNRNFPVEWISDNKLFVSKEYYNYINSLQEGETIKMIEYLDPNKIIKK